MRERGQPANGHKALLQSVRRLDRAQRRAVRARAEITAQAVRDEQLRAIERELTELRGRLNGLFFLVLGTGATEVLTRLWG